MTGGGENWITPPWDYIKWAIIMALCIIGAEGGFVGYPGGDDGWA